MTTQNQEVKSKQANGKLRGAARQAAHSKAIRDNAEAIEALQAHLENGGGIDDMPPQLAEVIERMPELFDAILGVFGNGSGGVDVEGRLAALEAKAQAIAQAPAERNWAIRARDRAENASYFGPAYVAVKEAGALRGAVELGLDAYKGIQWLLNR